MFEVKPCLLVIDDEPQLLRLYARVLSRDFVVEGASCAEHALRRIAEGSGFDAILCDLNLGQGAMSGQDFHDSLPEHLQARTVICSGAERDERNPFEVGLGARFVTKVGAVADLVALLLRVAAVSTRTLACAE